MIYALRFLEKFFISAKFAKKREKLAKNTILIILLARGQQRKAAIAHG